MYVGVCVCVSPVAALKLVILMAGTIPRLCWLGLLRQVLASACFLDLNAVQDFGAAARSEAFFPRCSRRFGFCTQCGSCILRSDCEGARHENCRVNLCKFTACKMNAYRSCPTDLKPEEIVMRRDGHALFLVFPLRVAAIKPKTFLQIRRLAPSM